MASLVYADTGKTRDGVITVVDKHTVKLTLLAPDITIIPSMADYPAATTHASHNADNMNGTAEITAMCKSTSGPMAIT